MTQTTDSMPRPHKDKARVLRAAKRNGRKVLWLDDKNLWHAATDHHNTPHYAKAIEEVK